MGLFSKSIQVKFVHAVSTRVLGETKMKLDRIPPEFSTETIVEINGESWKVTEAIPSTRKEIKAVGNVLVKVLRPDESLIVKEETTEGDPVLEMPQAEQEVIEREQTPVVVPHEQAQAQSHPKVAYSLKPEFWRALEWVDAIHEAKIRMAFQRIGEGHSGAILEVREEMGLPLTEARISPFSLRKEFFHSGYSYNGLSVAGMGEAVAGGFAFQSMGLDVYGKATPGAVEILGIGGTEPESFGKQYGALTSNLVRFMEHHRVILVDWARHMVATSDLPSLQHLFGKEEAPT